MKKCFLLVMFASILSLMTGCVSRHSVIETETNKSGVYEHHYEDKSWSVNQPFGGLSEARPRTTYYFGTPSPYSGPTYYYGGGQYHYGGGTYYSGGGRREEIRNYNRTLNRYGVGEHHNAPRPPANPRSGGPGHQGGQPPSGGHPSQPSGSGYHYNK